MTTYLDHDQIDRALRLRDLSDPAHGPHAMQLLLGGVVDALTHRWQVPARWHRTSPLVSVEDNYDRLGFDTADVTRDVRYSRYVGPTVMLRSHTSASVPWLLRTLAWDDDDHETDHDELQVLPGLVYRRDAIDRTHVGEPHQVDLWRTTAGRRLGLDDLTEMLATIVDAVLPGAAWRAVPVRHPYTDEGRQLDVLVGSEWLELAECGLIAPSLLQRSGLGDRWSGLALGMGLDRALMLRKGIDDIRVLRSTEPRIEAQLQDLAPWRPVSMLPPVRRDLSIVIDEDDDEETLGDRVREALGDQVELLESVAVINRTSYGELPEVARDRLGLAMHQQNALVRLVLRPLAHTLIDAQANSLRDQVYRAIHRGPRSELINA